jgi:retinol dehydrogenase-12
VLANNAGALFAGRKETSEGLERTLALNHLAPFLLTNLLRDRLAGGRVVTTASDAHESGRLDLDDLQSEKSFAAMRVYGTSKLCNILFTRELARRAPELHANCFHPGVVRTGFGKNENGIWKVLTTIGSPFFRSPERGARSLVWLALSDQAAELDGEYVQDEKVAKPSAQAQNDELARKLWERSAELVGLPADTLA